MIIDQCGDNKNIKRFPLRIVVDSFHKNISKTLKRPERSELLRPWRIEKREKSEKFTDKSSVLTDLPSRY